MQFETFHLMSSPALEPAATLYGNTFEQIRMADEMGFLCAWFAEHHFSNYCISPNPLLPAIKAATMTKRIRFGQAVLVTPLWHPMRLAMDIAMADILTEGRLNVGLGSGYSHTEYNALGIDIKENRVRQAEAIEIMLKAWSEDDFTYRGKFFNVARPVSALPRPFQSPHPPLHIAASHEESVIRVAQQGYGMLSSGQYLTHEMAGPVAALYHKSWREAGHAPDKANLHLLRFVHVAETDGKAQEQFDETRWLRRAGGPHAKGTAQVIAGRNQIFPQAEEPSDEEWQKRLVFGSPDTVIQILKGLEANGITHVMCHFDIGGMAQPAVRRSMELFAERVMPAFARTAVAAQ